MYFFISALRDLALSWLSIALCTTITAALQAWRLAGIVPLFWASEFVRYAISLDYMEYKAAVAIVFVDLRAVVALGVAIGIAPRICLYLLACIVDTHIAISLMITSITVRASNFIVKAMKKLRVLMIYEVVAWLCFLLLGIYLAFAFLFAVGTIVVAAQALSAMWVSASIATPETISFAATFAVGLCFWIPFILLCCRHLLILYICRW